MSTKSQSNSQHGTQAKASDKTPPLSPFLQEFVKLLAEDIVTRDIDVDRKTSTSPPSANCIGDDA